MPNLKKISKIQDINKAISHIKQIEFVKGDACITIPNYIKKNKHLIISLLYLDFDLYEPTKVALENLIPLIPKGGIVVFDELNDSRWPGETQALKEYIKLNKLNLKKFNYETHTTYYEVK